MPFGSVNEVRGVRRKSFGAPGAGGACFCATAGAATVSAAETSDRIERALMMVSSRSAAAGCGRRFRAGPDRVDRAVALAQILHGGLLQQGGRHLRELRLQTIDAGGIIIEQRE